MVLICFYSYPCRCSNMSYIFTGMDISRSACRVGPMSSRNTFLNGAFSEVRF